MKIELTTTLDRATLERADELCDAQNRWADAEFDRAAWTLETYLAAMLPIWIWRDWQRAHGLERGDATEEQKGGTYGTTPPPAC